MKRIISLLLLLLCVLCAAAQTQTARPGAFLATPEAAGTQLPLVTLSPGYQSPNPGVAASVIAQVSAASGTGPTPTGTITFFDTFDNATTQLGQPIALTSGEAMGSFTTLAVGSHSISAQYSGDGNYAAGSSSPVTVLVQKFTPTLILTLSTTAPSVGGTVVATATIVSSQSIAPTGSVTFTLDNNTAGVAALGGSSPSYSASQNITVSSGGSHTIGASYSGDANYGSATAPAVTISTGKSASVTTLTATPTSITAGTPETLTATIASAVATSGASTFTGTVTFYDGTTVLGNPVVVANNQAVLSVTLSATAAHTITAVYSGDASWLGSTSSPLVLSAGAVASSVALTVSSPVALAGSLVTFTATVSGTATNASGNPVTPTGTITYYDGNSPVGTATLQTSGGQTTASFFTSNLTAGSHQITAQYSGDTNFKAAVSSAVTIAIESFSITPSATSLTLTQGQSGTVLYTVADASGLTTSIQFGCQEPANTFTTCTFNPTALSGDGQTTLTITTTGPGRSSARNHGLGVFAKRARVLACLLLCCAPFGARFRRKLPKSGAFLAAMLAVLLLGSAALSGCSSGSSSSASTSTPTPTGTQSFKVITSTTLNNQVIQQNTYITVTVLPAS